mmetsp:Transcript_20542/g.59593  ORF Transcript_20542/g.59593 Transcript_20542/m.59593 type:complete len:216 (+) Transcript_20542:574-1221(+)
MRAPNLAVRRIVPPSLLPRGRNFPPRRRRRRVGLQGMEGRLGAAVGIRHARMDDSQFGHSDGRPQVRGRIFGISIRDSGCGRDGWFSSTFGRRRRRRRRRRWIGDHHHDCYYNKHYYNGVHDYDHDDSSSPSASHGESHGETYRRSHPGAESRTPPGSDRLRRHERRTRVGIVRQELPVRHGIFSGRRPRRRDGIPPRLYEQVALRRSPIRLPRE